MKILKEVAILFFITICVIFVIVYSYSAIIESEYEITEDSYHYTLSTIPQVIATIIGLIAFLSIYIIEGLRKRLTGKYLKKVINSVYLFLVSLLLLGSAIILYSLYYLPLFGFVEYPLMILVVATVGSNALLAEIIIFVLFTHSTEEM